MIPVKTQYANTPMGAPRNPEGVETPEYFNNVRTIWVTQTFRHFEEKGKVEQYPVTIVGWQPEPEDIARQLMGGILYTEFWGHHLPPQSLHSTSPFAGEIEHDEETDANNKLLHLCRSIVREMSTLTKVRGEALRVETKDGKTIVYFGDGSAFRLSLEQTITL